MVIQICIGSACHLRGSYDVIEKMKALIAADNLEDKITLKASFCLGRCGEYRSEEHTSELQSQR